jgi:hypothetical protein
MTDLFASMDKGASFSPCRKYRYSLWRIWDRQLPKVMFIGLNPSTANEAQDDPTIRRVMGFAKEWGFGGVYMANLFAWVTPHPYELLTCPDPIGDNDFELAQTIRICDKHVFAWGAFAEAKNRAAHVVSSINGRCYALAINKDGSPKHPLYVKGGTTPIPFPRNP